MDATAEREFRDFVAARSGALMRLAFLLSGGDQHAAEDLLQASLAKTAARWSRVDNPESYLRSVMYRQQVSWWRLRRSHEVPIAAPPESVDRGIDSDDIDLRLMLRQALARLTPRQRATLVLRYFEDLSEAEVARLLGCSVGTVRSTTHRSLARLRAVTAELGVTPARTGSPTSSVKEVSR